MRKKVTVVGGGFVGATTAQRIVDMELADVVLCDIMEGIPVGKGLDMLESTPITRSDSILPRCQALRVRPPILPDGTSCASR